MERDLAAEWRRWRKEWEVSGGTEKMKVAGRTEKMEVAEKEAREEGKAWMGGAEAEEVADGSGGDVNMQHQNSDISNRPGVYGGAVIICNHVTKRQFFEQKHFALPGYAATFIKKIRAGMLLFLFEHQERKLYGVFEATSDGALNILPDSCASSYMLRPAQVLFRRVWFCKPLTEAEFSDAIKGHCLQPQMSFLGISYQQVLSLVDLFSSRMIRLQLYQKPKSRVLRDYKISLARTGQEFGLSTHNDCFSHSSSMFCNNRISSPHSPFMYAKHNGKHTAHKHESPLHPWPKSAVFKAPDTIEKSKPDDTDYIPLELGDCDSDSAVNRSTLMGTVSFHSKTEGIISREDQVPKPFNVKDNEDDRCHSQLNQRFISESETDQNSAISHIVKESKSKLQAMGCKRKATVQLDELSDVLSPMRACDMVKNVSFSFGVNGISAASDKALLKPTLAELQQNREAVLKERKEQLGFSPRDNLSKGDASAKWSKLMRLSFVE
ncbi:hypothetical protein U9M48_029583 [Paspalum notatum var. saurae]|uniref:DCD domain-containing protein n=1 Tax=Paspalum notatum var. saurae TaxID=547442 RepID=A0AAQ3TZ69_PASNO